MDFGEIAGQLSGPNGGLFALGMFVGAMITFALMQRYYIPALDQARKAEIDALRGRITALEETWARERNQLHAEIQLLRQYESRYRGLLEANSTVVVPDAGNPHASSSS